MRPLNEGDVRFLFQLRNEPANYKFLDVLPPQSIDQVRIKLRSILLSVSQAESFFWIIEEVASEEPIGTICLWNFNKTNRSAEVGYELKTAFQGKGYMTEALSSLVQETASMKVFDQLQAYTNKENIASIKLLQKVGFNYQKTIKDESHESKKPSILVFYSRSLIDK